MIPARTVYFNEKVFSIFSRGFLVSTRKSASLPTLAIVSTELLCTRSGFTVAPGLFEHHRMCGSMLTVGVAQKSYDEIVDLFARTSSAEILAFRPSTESQERVRYLLERNKNGELTEAEAAELNRFG